jgi:hypothetical protein
VIPRLVHLLTTPRLLLLPGRLLLAIFSFLLVPLHSSQPSRFLAAVFPCPPSIEHPLSFGGLALKFEPPTQLSLQGVPRASAAAATSSRESSPPIMSSEGVEKRVDGSPTGGVVDEKFDITEAKSNGTDLSDPARKGSQPQGMLAMNDETTNAEIEDTLNATEDDLLEARELAATFSLEQTRQVRHTRRRRQQSHRQTGSMISVDVPGCECDCPEQRRYDACSIITKLTSHTLTRICR